MTYRITKTSALAATGAAVALGALTACGGGSSTSGAQAAMQLKPQTSSTAAPTSTSSSAAPKPSTTSATPKKTPAKTTTRATAGGVSRDQARATLTPRAAAPKATPKKVTPKKVTPNRVAPAKKVQPAKAPRTTPKPRSASNAGLDLSRAGMWDRIAMCESTGNWHINTGNGYFGGLQFDIGTWLGAGGGQFAARADLATREQQITIANKVFASRGLSPWQCASAA
ncbi:transglycosylase family protein [Flexivirga meconopsidis]|uniref:transglycosylase family protein n=1 Tax=Flexivirga meconopsidis TaxID=2977121 RepID=UPI003CC5BE0E